MNALERQKLLKSASLTLKGHQSGAVLCTWCTRPLHALRTNGSLLVSHICDAVPKVRAFAASQASNEYWNRHGPASKRLLTSSAARPPRRRPSRAQAAACRARDSVRAHASVHVECAGPAGVHASLCDVERCSRTAFLHMHMALCEVRGVAGKANDWLVGGMQGPRGLSASSLVRGHKAQLRLRHRRQAIQHFPVAEERPQQARSGAGAQLVLQPSAFSRRRGPPLHAPSHLQPRARSQLLMRWNRPLQPRGRHQ